MSLLGQCYYATCGTRLGHTVVRGIVETVRGLGGRRRFHMPFDALELDHDAAAGLMRLWSRTHWSSGDGMMPPEQLLAVYRLAVTWPAVGDVVELGAWVGLTTCYLATASQVRGNGKVYAVDTFAGTKEGDSQYPSIARHGGNTLAAFQDQVSRACVEDLVEPLVGYTTDVASTYPGRPVRMLLIDADHSYDGVRSDFETWAPHVAPGGLIVFHDYLMPDVTRFVDNVVGDDQRFDMTPGEEVANLMAVTKRAAAPRAVLPTCPVWQREEHPHCYTEGRATY
jgi:predicted O-methyltransferase YrrM